MPFYQCTVPAGVLTPEQKQQIAIAFTDVHCGISAVPRNFVQVVFQETAPGQSAGRLPYYIAGGNRAGRPSEVRERILDGLIQSVSDIAGVSREQIGGRITETPSSWVMEAGSILPEPGQEPAEWYEHAGVRGYLPPRRQHRHAQRLILLRRGRTAALP